MHLNYGVTVKVVALVAVPPGVVTTTLPVFAPAGTVAVIWLSLFTVNVPDFPPTVTLVAWVKPLPVILTTVATTPLVGLIVVIAGSTRKLWLVRSVSSDVTIRTKPVSAPTGTFAVRKVSETTLNVARVPLNETLLALVNP